MKEGHEEKILKSEHHLILVFIFQLEPVQTLMQFKGLYLEHK